MKRALVATMVILVMVGVCYAEEKGTPKKMADTFFEGLRSGEVSQAYDALFSGSYLVERKPQEVEVLKKQTQLGLSLFGDMVGYELISEEVYGSSLVRLIYVQKMTIHPLTWEFYFYRPKKEWFVSNVIINDNFIFLKGLR